MTTPFYVVNMVNIDKIFFINLDHRTDRWEKLEKDFIPLLPDQYQDKVERISAVDNTHYESINQRAAGASLSHLKIWKKCIKENLDTVLIFEDDVEWATDVNTINYYFKEIDNLDFELINFSYRYRDHYFLSNHKDFLYGLDLILCSGYLVKVHFLKDMYNHVYYHTCKLLEDESFKKHAIDVAWNKYLFNKDTLKLNTKWYQTKTKLVIQYKNHSNINNGITDSEVAFHIHARFYSCLGDINETI